MASTVPRAMAVLRRVGRDDAGTAGNVALRFIPKRRRAFTTIDHFVALPAYAVAGDYPLRTPRTLAELPFDLLCGLAGAHVVHRGVAVHDLVDGGVPSVFRRRDRP